MLEKILKLVFGSKNERTIKKLLPLVREIHALEESMRALSKEDFHAQTQSFRKELEEGAPDARARILPQAFAAVREAAWRSLGLRHFDVQILGALILDEGRIAEMKTGEGKTLTATAAIYFNALSAKGVHVVTVNDYLARRDAQWMQPVYEMLGLSVGVIQSQMGHAERKEAYQADITYGTNSEFGFDYLRDNMLTEKEDLVQRAFHFAIVDEVDSILIDEARTPLIISGPTQENTSAYRNIDNAIRRLIEAEAKAPAPEVEQTPSLQIQAKPPEPHLLRGYYYDIDEKARNVFLTEKGTHELEKILSIDNLYAPNNTELVAHSSQALRAHLIFKDEVDYVVHGGEVLLVDEHTGRTMPGRRYGDGLHQALEAKERVEIKQESQTLASVTYQNFFRMYPKLAGMTGTADTEAAEFKKIYNLEICMIPTNLPVRRKDYPDRIYRTEQEKYSAIVEEIKECMQKGQPVLVGTISIEKSEQLSELIRKHGMAHSVLNARHHAREAEIIANAGKYGAVTIATNMAGRGTDIVLGGAPHYLPVLEELAEDDKELKSFKEAMLKKDFPAAQSLLEGLAKEEPKRKRMQSIYEDAQKWSREHERVKEAGGLHILGSERHESRRIDNQLRGRSGRQGDPGSSRFYLSLEDNLMRIFGGERIKNLMGRIGMQEGQELEASMVDRAIARAQKRVENHNFDIRKHLLEYDEVMNKQREFVYKERSVFLHNEKVRERLMAWVEESIESHILLFCPSKDIGVWDWENLQEYLQRVFMLEAQLKAEDMKFERNPQLKLFENIQKQVLDYYQKEKVDKLGEEALNYVERRIALDVIDARWKEHLHQLDQLREGVWASGYAERNPLVEFKIRGFELFDEMVESIKEQLSEFLFHVQIAGPLEKEGQADSLSQGMRSHERSSAMQEQHENYNSFSAVEAGAMSGKKPSLMPLNNVQPMPSSAPATPRKTTKALSGGGASQRRKSRRRK